MKKIHFMALSLMAMGYTYAQEVPTTVTETTESLPAPAQEAPKPEPKIEVKPAGRILIDAGYFNANEQKDKFVSGVAIPDARAGLGVRYGNWKAKVDIGYAYGKLSPKDIFIEYGFSKHTPFARRLFRTSIWDAKCHQFFFQNIDGRTPK